MYCACAKLEYTYFKSVNHDVSKHNVKIGATAEKKYLSDKQSWYYIILCTEKNKAEENVIVILYIRKSLYGLSKQ